MTAGKSVKGGAARPLVVGVISSAPELQRALRLRRWPDLFELRLDALGSSLDELEKTSDALRVPLIITARHPQEGGHGALSARQRRELLLRFIPRAAWLDVELRSLGALQPVLEQGRELQLRLVLSVHQFTRTPGAAQLRDLAARAFAAGADVFKIATRTDTAAELQRLLDLFDEAQAQQQRVSAMGIGKLGRESRLLLARRGSALNYAHLASAAVEGQLSLAELRRALRR